MAYNFGMTVGGNKEHCSMMKYPVGRASGTLIYGGRAKMRRFWYRKMLSLKSSSTQLFGRLW